MKIRDKLFHFLFKKEAQRIFLAEGRLAETTKTLADRNNHMRGLELEISFLRQPPKVSMADLMRECLGLVPVGFTDTDKEGCVYDILDENRIDKATRDYRIGQLNAVFNNDVFQLLCKNKIDAQGNFSLRHEPDAARHAGRFSINGIYTIMNAVEKAHMLYLAQNPPKEEEDFDEHAVI